MPMNSGNRREPEFSYATTGTFLTGDLEKLQGNDLPVERLMAGIMEVVEHHCRQTGQYEERADSATGGYRLGEGRARPSSGR
ncbi:hypothetical protein [Pseudoxanthomonas mexicana]|uniref:hypothetical protein n=1 Tax=Pseudoxanthomonas mexicana TaxID=128785 RepID=UPI00398AA07B